MKSLTLLVVAMASQLALAYTIDCPEVGRLLDNSDSLIITYSEKLGFSDIHDTASFVGMGPTEAQYVANKWGALITLPNALLSGTVKSAEVTFLVPETTPASVTCTVEK